MVWPWYRHFMPILLPVLLVLGTLAFFGDFLFVAVRFWWIAGPVTLALCAAIYPLTPPGDPAPPGSGKALLLVLARLGMTIGILFAMILGLGFIISLRELLGWAAWVLAAVVAIMIGVGLYVAWDERRRAPRPIVSGGAKDSDIVR